MISWHTTECCSSRSASALRRIRSTTGWRRFSTGSTAYFTVTLFGDNLTYRWYCYDTQTNQWVLADTYYGTTFRVLSVNANASTNHKQFMCVVWNKQGYYIYSNAVTLTVV